MAGLTLDTGALVAADRNSAPSGRSSRRLRSGRWSRSSPPRSSPRPGAAPRQARLSQLVKACFVEPLEEDLAKAAGELLGRAKGSDVVDAAVVAGAAGRGDLVVTSDAKDLRRLAAEAVGTVEVIKL